MGADFLFARPSFWQGFGSVLDLGGTWFEFNRSLNEEQADHLAMLMDWRMVGNHIQGAADQIGREQRTLQGRLSL